MAYRVNESVLDLSSRYDVFFIDVYGVLYNGIGLYEGTLETLEALKRQGKKVYILSNATLVANDLKESYKERGFCYQKHYDDMITSGEYLRYTLMRDFEDINKAVGCEVKNVYTIFKPNPRVFEQSPTEFTDNMDDAQLVYMGMPEVSYGEIRVDNLIYRGDKISFEDIFDKDWREITDPDGRQGMAEIVDILEKCLERKLKILVANPDMFAHEFVPGLDKKYPLLKQGAIAECYKRMGGEVIMYGKPYSGIFEYAKTYLRSNDRAVMIGDTPWTDICGGNNAGLKTILVMTGVVEEFFSQFNQRLTQDEKFDKLFKKISPKMYPDKNVIPTHIVKHFAQQA